MTSPATGPLSKTEARCFLVIVLGSAGDVHAFAGLAQALHGPRHRVKVITNPYFESLIAELGLEFSPFSAFGARLAQQKSKQAKRYGDAEC